MADEENVTKSGKVVFLGVEGAGKSTLTAALVTYFNEYESRGWTLRPENKEAFAFSVRVPKKFSEGNLPAQTATFKHLRWSICYNDEPQRTLEVLDYPGEIYRLAFLDPAEDSNPSALQAKQKMYESEIREMMSFLKDAEQVYVLFNIDDSQNLDESNANIDAVWVTMSSIRILSSLNPGPEITLLITQADKLRSQGESIDDVEQIVNKHIPLISRRYKNLKKVLVSATEYNDEHIGVLPLVFNLILNTNLYKIALPKMEKCLSNLKRGRDVLKEFDKLKEVAKGFDFCSDTAKAFTATKGGWSDAIKEFRLCINEVREIQNSSSDFKKKALLLEKIKGRICFEMSKKYIDGLLKVYNGNMWVEQHIDNENQGCLTLLTVGIVGFMCFLFAFYYLFD